MWQYCILSLVFVASALETVTRPAIDDTQVNKTFGFEVDHENDQFLLDGQPFRYVSGSFHYFRTPRQYWRDRLRKMRAGGLNAVSTYVEWSLHQPEIDKWQWSGEADIVEFINIAREEDLLVLLRPGPYICAERNLGGLPPWLMTVVPDIKMRENDPHYMHYVEVYLRELLTRLEPLLRGNGGPIIMVQIENEYGSFRACDAVYRRNLYNIMKRYVGSKALLYTTDGSSTAALRCGAVEGAYATIDFGTVGNVSQYFAIMRAFQPTGPLVNSEFYPGWLSHWGEPFQRVNTTDVVRVLDEILALDASVNIYMYYGGTNFGFTAGANGPQGYAPQLTSYDYDAPLTEAGDPTDKYFAIRDVIAKYLPLKNLTLPTVKAKGNYGSVAMEPVVKLFDPVAKRTFGSVSGTYKTAPTFEQLGIAHNLVLYETILPESQQDPALLYARTMDRGLVYVNSRLAGLTSRSDDMYALALVGSYGKNLQILVENQGHLNFGSVVEDWKGLLDATIDGEALSPWNVTGFKLDTVEQLTFFNISEITINTGVLSEGPVFLRGHFNVVGEPLDTYLDTTGWGKGVAYVNNHNLGRYWPLAGPQMTLYVPSAYLKNGLNTLVLLEFEYVPTTRLSHEAPGTIKFRDTANLG